MSKDEGTKIQEALNARHCTSDDGQPLVIDGQPGNKTWQAFDKLNAANGGELGVAATLEAIKSATVDCKGEIITSNVSTAQKKAADIAKGAGAATKSGAAAAQKVACENAPTKWARKILRCPK